MHSHIGHGKMEHIVLVQWETLFQKQLRLNLGMALFVHH